jgi:hypothetical protein
MPPVTTSHWLRLLTWLLLGLSVLATGAAIVLFCYLINLWVAGYSGGGNPASISALAFPLAMLVFLVFEIPAVIVSGLFWVAYRAASARSGTGFRRAARRAVGSG